MLGRRDTAPLNLALIYMNNDYQKLLHTYDEEGNYEFPSEFNEQDLESRARKVYNSISSMGLSCKFEDWVHNQDASFGLAIILNCFEDQSNSNMVAVPVIRFSNFGNLATFTFEELMPIEFSRLIPGLLKANGFNYIPQKVAESEYDGVMRGNPDFPTWWVRYFDWI